MKIYLLKSREWTTSTDVFLVSLAVCEIFDAYEYDKAVLFTQVAQQKVFIEAPSQHWYETVNKIWHFHISQ